MLYSIRKKIEKNKKLFLLILLIIMIFLLGVFYLVGKQHESNKVITTNSINLRSLILDEDNFPYHVINNVDEDISDANAIDIDLNKYFEEEYLIDDGGTYELTGKLDGRIVINAKNEYVHLLLNNMDIESTNGPALIIKNATQVTITTLKDTNNKITDSGNYRKSLEYESCIQSEEPLTINGEGTLSVYGLYKDAIRSRDTIKILGGNITIQAKRSAIHATDGININNGQLFIASEKYGIKTTKNSVNNRGALIISGGQMNIIAGKYAFVSDAPVYIYNCSIYNNSVATFDANNLHVQAGCINE